MIKITNVGTTQTARINARKRTGATGSTAFSGLLDALDGDSAVNETANVNATIATSSLNPMLSLQEMPDDEFNKKQAIKKGKSMLDSLEEIRHGLLMGSLPFSTLSRLEMMVQEQRMGTSDPRLQAILDDIELRAAVELAKIEMARARTSS